MSERRRESEQVRTDASSWWMKITPESQSWKLVESNKYAMPSFLRYREQVWTSFMMEYICNRWYNDCKALVLFTGRSLFCADKQSHGIRYRIHARIQFCILYYGEQRERASEACESAYSRLALTQWVVSALPNHKQVLGGFAKQIQLTVYHWKWR